MLIIFIKLMRKQKNFFDDIFYREELGTPGYDLMYSLTKFTKAILICLSIFYEYKLLMRIVSSLLYTHEFILYFKSQTTIEALNYVFFSLTIFSTLMTMGAGLLFLGFSYVLHKAYVKQSLFGSGLLVDEEDEEIRTENSSQKV